MATYEHNPRGLPDTDLRYTPVLRGDVYCSPACGRGCKKSEYDQAKNRADNLAKRLGYGWTPFVWENLGWHYHVSKGTVTVRCDSDGTYSAEIDTDELKQVWLDGYRDPRKAVAALQVEMGKVIAAATRAKAALELEPISIKS